MVSLPWVGLPQFIQKADNEPVPIGIFALIDRLASFPWSFSKRLPRIKELDTLLDPVPGRLCGQRCEWV